MSARLREFLDAQSSGASAVVPPVPRTRPVVRQSNRAAEFFLKGPLAWRWLAAAAQLPGRSLDVAIALAMQSALERETSFRVVQKWRNSLGVTRGQEARALSALAAAGLIVLETHRGRRPHVALVGHEPRTARSESPAGEPPEGIGEEPALP